MATQKVRNKIHIKDRAKNEKHPFKSKNRKI